MQDFDKVWDYSDPAATEQKFKNVLEETAGEADLSYYLQLQTQIARTYSLRAMFTEAHATLDKVLSQLPEEPTVPHIRYHLERGRTYNSAGNRGEAKIHFEQAKQIAEVLKEDGYAIDAMHMLAIVANPLEGTRINEEAIIFAESSVNEQAKNWLGSLYNNLGWDYFDQGAYEKALSIFLRALKWYEDKKFVKQTFIAKWTVARTLRALGKIDQAIIVQLALFEESVNTGHPDGYVHEELGELHLLKNDKLKSTFHFEKAYEILSANTNLAKHEKERLERIKTLSK